MSFPESMRSHLADSEGLVFDCDGTLADTMPIHWTSWQIISDLHQFEFSEDRFYSLGGVPSVKILESIKKDQGHSFDPVDVARQKEVAYLKNLDSIQPIDWVVEIARENFGKKPMAVASGGTNEVISEVLTRLRLDQLFEVVVTCEDVTHQKPAPDIFLKAAERMGVAPEKCLGFEDSELGMESIRRAGMLAIHVPCNRDENGLEKPVT